MNTTTVTQLPLIFTIDPLATFIEVAAHDANVQTAARNWIARRGGNLRPEDIRQMRSAVKQVAGYGNWVFDHADFLDRVAYGTSS